MLLGYEDWVSEVEERGERRRGGGRFGGGPRSGEVERGGGLGVEKSLQPGEEGEGEVGRFAGGGGGEVDGLDGGRIVGVEGQVRVESYAGGFPNGRITAPVAVR